MMSVSARIARTVVHAVGIRPIEPFVLSQRGKQDVARRPVGDVAKREAAGHLEGVQLALPRLQLGVGVIACVLACVATGVVLAIALFVRGLL